MYHKSLFCSFRYFVLYADVFVYMDSIQFISLKMKFITMNLYMQRCILTIEKFHLTILMIPKYRNYFEWKPTNFISKIQCLLAHLTYLFQLLNNSVRDMTHEERVISPIWAKWEKIWKHEMRETRSRCGVEYIYFNPTLFWPNTFWQPPILKRNYSNLVLVVDVFC